ncbi:MAG: hypothetical protein AAF611_06570 [Bacteroidota bacterium]
MKTIQTQTKYIEWISADDMHTDSLQWLSQLRFINDEHIFFENLIDSFSAQLRALDIFSSDKEIIDTLTRSYRHNEHLIQKVMRHENGLKIMVDGVDQLEDEKKYKEAHLNIASDIEIFLKEYQVLKMQLFNIIKGIKKEEKLETLLDHNH